jgi:hypothetical protein
MNKLLLIFSIFNLILLSSCQTKQSCNQLSTDNKSYDEVLTEIKSLDFKIIDNVNTSNSSWIRAASFYSCDGKTGYFILRTDKKEYLHASLPYSVWIEFKNAKSFGKYYNKSIKNTHSIELTK